MSSEEIIEQSERAGEESTREENPSSGAAPQLESPVEEAVLDPGIAEPEVSEGEAATPGAGTAGSPSLEDERALVETIVAEAVAGSFTDEAETRKDHLKAIVEAIIYVTDEPLTAQQIAGALGLTMDEVRPVLDELTADYACPDRGLSIREIAGGFKMATKPEHHEEIRQFVRNLKPPLKLSLAALETLAVIAYKQPVTAPEILEIRGVQGVGVLKTLLDRKLIATAGRKAMIGKPILYKTTKDFLTQFGLKDLSELPTLKEFEELNRLALSEPEDNVVAPPPPAAQPQADGAEVNPTPEPVTDSSLGEAGGVEARKGPGVPGEPTPEQPEPPVEPPGPEPEPVEEPPAPVIPEKLESPDSNG